MSSAKAALESDTRVHTFLESPMVLPHAYSYLQAFFSVQVLAYEAGRKGKIRVNTISAGNCFFFFSFPKKVNKPTSGNLAEQNLHLGTSLIYKIRR